MVESLHLEALAKALHADVDSRSDSDDKQWLTEFRQQFQVLQQVATLLDLESCRT